MKQKALLFFLFLFFGLPLSAESPKKTIFYQIEIQDEINSTSWRHVQQAFSKAAEIRPEAILIHLNTYGGELLYADSIRTKLLHSPFPVYVFVDNNAASAGALISLAADRIYMRSGASIGAATVVDGNGEQVPDKYQSYMRGIMRATAKAQGQDTIVSTAGDTVFKWRRDPQIAEAMVDDRIVIPNLIDSGRILTFDTQEAIKHGFCDGIAESMDEVITKLLGTKDYEIVHYKPTAIDGIMGFLTGTVLRGILIMLIIGGIYFELQSPGIGFPLAVAIAAAVLYFAPLYLDGLAANWEILLFVVGLILLAVEIFVLPGFGVAGISGIVLMVGGLVLSLVGNVAFNFDGVEVGGVSRAVITVLSSMILTVSAGLYISSRIGHKGMFRRVALEAEQNLEEGYIGVPTEQRTLIGKAGVARTDLRPSGKVIVEGEVYDAVSEDGFIEQDSKIVVNRYETGQIYVGRLK